MVNSNLLNGKIMAAGHTQRSLAPKVGMSPNSLNAKISGRNKFDTEEIGKICKALGITDPREKCDIFLS